MSSESLAGFVGRSLAALREEVPTAHRAMCAAATGRCVHLEMDGEAVGLVFDPREVRLEAVAADADVRVRTTRRATLALADAETTLVAAVEADALEVAGRPDDVLAFHDALHAYFCGAVRAPSFPKLLAAFRRTLDTRGEAR